jgi:PKD repeat protein
MLERRPLIASCVAATLVLASLVGIASPVAAAQVVAAAEADVLDQPRHGEDAIRRLGAQSADAAARNGMTVAQLHAKLRDDASYFVDRKGRLVVHDTGLLAGETAAAIPVTSTAAPFSYTDTFQLHSRPGARRVIFLDFDGHDVAGTAWNANYTGGAPFAATSYDTDGQAGFSAAEQDVVQSVWQRVTEDYSPFDVDVTTQDPGEAAITRSGSTDQNYGTRAVITNTSTVYSACGCGGIAYVGTYDLTSNHANYQPAFVFQQGVGAGAHNIAEATSHEVGHNLGLSHDGTASLGYYTGHGEWAPIMGVGYYEPLTQWSRGEYSGANNTEDDFAVMQANGAPLRPDDHGDSAAAATALAGPALGATGHIGSSTDTDWFTFATAAGDVSLEVTAAPTSPNLDASLAIFDAAGTQLALADPLSAQVSGDLASGLNASLALTLAAGTYRVRVDGVGKGTPSTGYSDYASVGQFTLTGTVPISTPGNAAPTAVASASVTSGVAPLTVTFSSTDSSDSDGTIAARSWSFGDGTADSIGDGSHVYSSPGTFTASLTVVDDGGAPSRASMAIIVTAPVVEAPAQPTAPTDVVATKSGRLVTVRWSDTSSTETGFTVRREKQAKNGTWSNPATVTTTAANTTSITNSPGNGTYRYSVRANGSGGSSGYVLSNIVTI